MKLLLRWLFSASTLMILAYYMPGITVHTFYNALIAALVLGLANAVIRPLLILLTLPINILTLGFFTLIINASVFWFVSTVVKGFYVSGFWVAFWASLILWIVGWLVNGLFKK